MSKPYIINPNLIPTILYMTSIILRNSPQFYTNNQKQDQPINFIFSVINLPTSMVLILNSINLVMLIFSIGFLLYWKIKTYYFQIFYYIIAPISVYFSKRQFINAWENNQIWGVVFYGICETLFCLIMLVYPIFQFHIKTQRIQTINHINTSYPVLVNISCIIMSFSYILNMNIEVILGILFSVYLIRSCIVFLKISYQSLQIEYTTIIGQMYSWIGLVLLYLKVYYEVDIRVLCWVNALIAIYFVFYPNTTIVYLVQAKYLRILGTIKQSMIDYEDQPKTQTKLFAQSQLVQLFCCLLCYVKGHENNEIDWQRKIRFSQYFNAETISVMGLILREKDNIVLEQNKSIKIQHTNKLTTTNINKQQNHHWLQIWNCIKTIKQLQQPNYNKLRKLIIYNMPLINPIINYKLLRLYYLGINCDEKYLNIYTRIINNMMYQYLSQRILIELEQYERSPFVDQGVSDSNLDISNSNNMKVRLQQSCRYNNIVDNKINAQQLYYKSQQQQLKKNNQQKLTKNNQQQNINRYCLPNISSYYTKQLAHYDLYYQQSQIQQSIYTKFIQIFSTQQQIITLVSKRQNNTQILQNLIRKNQLKQQIKDLIQSINSTHQFKTILFTFVYQYTVLNLPHVAVNNLKQSKIKQFFTPKNNNKHHQKITLTKGTLKNINQSRLEQKNIQQNKMILLVSGIKNFGKIVHCCKVFKQKMDLNKLNNSNTIQNNINQDKLTIYDIMLPLWVDKHKDKTKSILVDGNFSNHESINIHIMSCFEKRIYQANFKMYPIIRQTQDLLLGLDITFRQIDKLCIYHNQRQVFHSLSNKYSDSRITFIKSRKFKDNDTQIDENNCIKSKQVIFGQEYVVMKTYKDGKKNQNCSRNKKRKRSRFDNKQATFINNVNSQTQSELQQLSQKTFTKTFKSFSQQNQLSNQTLQQEIKMNQYVQSTLFYQNKLKLFSLMHWSIPPFIMAACLFLHFYSASQQAISKNITQTKINVYQQFLLVDTNFLTQLYYMKMLHENINNTQFHSNTNNILPFLVDDLHFNSHFIKQRQQLLYNRLSQSDQLLQLFLQDDETVGSTSVYFTQLIFDLQAEEYLQHIGFDIHNNNTIENLQSIYNDDIRVSINTDRFFKMFKHRYERYFQKINSLAILPTLSQLQLNKYQYVQNYFLIALTSIIIMSLITSIIFIYIYIDLQFHIQKLVLKCLNLPDQLMKKTFSIINLSKELLQNCKQTYPNKILAKLNFCENSQIDTSFNSIKTKEIFLSRQFVKKYHKEQIYDSMVRICRKSWPFILFFFIIVVVLQIFLVLLINELKSDIQNTQNYSNGIQKLTGLVSLSNQITMEIFFKFENRTNINNNLYEKQDQFYHSQKINFITSLQPNNQKFIELVYFDICNINNQQTNKTICPNYNQKTTFSYAQVIASNLKLFKEIHQQMNKLQTLSISEQFASINIHFSKLIKYLSLLNRYAHQMVNIGKRNLQLNKSKPQTFFYLIILEMVFVVLSFNWFTYQKMYKRMKIYYQQAFKICPLQQFQTHSAMNFYFNQAKQQKINYVSGSYKTLD